MHIGVPKETGAQCLVAATPKTVSQLVKLGYAVLVEHGAGGAASIPDTEYETAGATLATTAQVWAANVVVSVDPPTPAQALLMQPNATLVTRIDPDLQNDLVSSLRAGQVTVLSLTAVPRISRAQSLDVLSTMTNVAGYRGIIEAAQSYAGMFGGQVTAAGSTPPAQVFVIGAGVAGLAAIGAATSLGATVRAYDVRADAAEQIESMGATAVHVAASAQDSADGYASELTSQQLDATATVYAAESAAADVVVTTALIRGKAPITITADMVAAMRPGSVVVDLAASGGGNCELTVVGEKIVTPNGVTIIGYTDLPGRMPKHTSQLYGTNIVNLLSLLTPAKDGRVVIDLDDVVQRGMTVTKDGELLWPPPPISVSAQPAASAPASSVKEFGDATEPHPEVRQTGKGSKASGNSGKAKLALWSGLTLIALLAAITFAPAVFAAHFTIFLLAVVVGFYVVTGVSHSLHTPLMAQTNAISGIILVGAILQLGSTNNWITALSFVAATVAAINIFGGFMVASRMLAMFRKDA